MTTTVRDVIKAELFRVCLETTTKYRTKHEKKEKKEKYTSEEVQKVRDAFKGIGWNEDQVSKQMEALAILHDAPELKKPTIPSAEPFCVMVSDKNASGHPNVGQPMLFAKKRDSASFYYMDSQGRVEGNHWQYILDAVRFATDEEVKSCMDNLNADQWKRILYDPLFKPIIDTAMDKAVQVEDTPPGEEEKDNGEITVYGRAITVTDE